MEVKGLFISFEGIDKSGKSTQIHLLTDFLISRNYPVVITREPGGTALGEKIKKVLLEGERKIDPLAELFLYLADRAQHVKEVIEPSLHQGKVVISDRYTDATLAYQGYGRGLSIELIQKLNQEVTRGIWPDITFLLDLKPEIAIRREKMSDRIEKERLSFHRRVREGYLKVAELYSQRVRIIRADTPPLSIHKLIKKVIMDKFNHGLS